jgi:UDP-N-acetylmuramoyl-tripeptide--D-alanyl-D-alanine ligase
VAVLGKMLELGSESERGHREVGETAAIFGVDYLIGLGDDAIARAAQHAGLENSIVAQNASEAAEKLSDIVSTGDLVLIKGSRFSRTELVLEEFAKLRPAAGGNAR